MADRRKLGCVADHHQAAVRPVTDVVHEVFQQIAGAEHCRGLLAAGIDADKRNLIYDEQRILRLVRGQ